MAYSSLDEVSPLPPDQVRVHTLNAGPWVGAAARVTLDLSQYGFQQSGNPANDPRHPDGDMRCFGQIRFGSNGEAAARTLSFVVPCAQLVMDNRQDAVVDLVLGSYFTDLAPSPDAIQVLAQLNTWSAGHPGGGGLESAAELPSVSERLLAGAHTFRC